MGEELIGMSEYTYYYDRQDEPLISMQILIPNKEQKLGR